MALISVYKVVSSVPASLDSNALYLVRTGTGFDFYVSDSTGSVAYQINSSAAGLSNIVEDTTPQLGGDLDLNGNDITGTGNISIAGEIEADIHIGSLRGEIQFKAKAGEALTKGDPVYISSYDTVGNTPIVAIADANDSAKMPCFGLANESVSLNASVNVVTFGTLSGLDTSGFGLGDTLYISNTGTLTNSKPTGESSLIQNIGKVQRVDNSAGSIKVGGAGRTNDVPNLNQGNVFIGNASNQAETRGLTLDDIAETATNKHFTSGDKSKLNGIESGATADQTDAEIKTAYENNANTNAFTDVEKTKLSGIAAGAEVNVNADWNAVSGDAQILNKPTTITSAEQTKLGHISVTQAVDLDTMESDIATNNAKVSNATHTGDVTGSTALTISDEAVTNAKMAHVATGTVKGRITTGLGDVEDLAIDTTLKTALGLVKSDVGLSNVPNVDTTNASNITGGTLHQNRHAYEEFGKSATGNFGQFVGHLTVTDFNTTVNYWGWTFVAGTTNAPNTTSSQWYRLRCGLGVNTSGAGYGFGTSSSDFWLEIAYPRFNHSTAGVHMRTCENGTIGSWTEISGAGGSIDAGTITSGTLNEARLPTINADNTIITNLEVDNLKSGVLDTDLSSVSANDDTLPSAKAAKAYSDSLPGATNLSLSNNDLSVFTAANNKIEIKPNTGSNSESLELTGASTTGVFVGINTNHNVLPLSACTKNGSTGYTVSDAIAAVLYDSTDIFPSGTYGTYGIYMGADVQNGHGWIQTGRTNATQNNGNAFNLLLQPSAGNVGIGTTSATAKLTVNGSVSKTSGSFDIEHPDPKKKDTHRLRHYFVETPSAGGNIYKYQLDCNEGENYIDLPDYFQHLNTDSLVWANPFKHFGRAWGEVVGNGKRAKIVCEQSGVYNILIFGDRKDEIAVKEFDQYGVEYKVDKNQKNIGVTLKK